MNKIFAIPTNKQFALLFDNAHYALSQLGNPGFSDQLKQRYINIQKSLTPQLLSHIKRKLGEDTAIDYILFLGSATEFSQYQDIDITVGLHNKSGKPETLYLPVTNELGQQNIEEIEIIYNRVDKINAHDYIHFVYSKPVLYGTIPNLFQADRDHLLTMAAKKVLNNAQKRIQQNDLRKAAHRLLACARHLHNRSVPLPKNYKATLKQIYIFEQSNDKKSLTQIANQVSEWI